MHGVFSATVSLRCCLVTYTQNWDGLFTFFLLHLMQARSPLCGLRVADVEVSPHTNEESRRTAQKASAGFGVGEDSLDVYSSHGVSVPSVVARNLYSRLGWFIQDFLLLSRQKPSPLWKLTDPKALVTVDDFLKNFFGHININTLTILIFLQ